MLDVFGLFKVDTLYVVIGLLVITIAAIVLAIVAICKACAMTKKYEMMMEGSDGKSMEKMVRKYTDDIINLQKTSEDNTEAIKDIYEKMQLTFQKVGVNKYDAFHEMGGKLSFALCMLDKKDNGYVVNVMHSNDGCFAYIKVDWQSLLLDNNGKSYIELGKEEEKAVKQALAGRMGDEELSKEINDLMQKDKM